MKELQIILSILGALFILDIIRRVFFHGDISDRYHEEREKRQPPTFGS